MEEKIQLAEAYELANYYWDVRYLDSYFQKRWIWAEENLNKKLDNLLGHTSNDALAFNV